jgi:hypothetical protein
MRLLLFGWLEFETDDVRPGDMDELRRCANECNETVQTLIEGALGSMSNSGVVFTPPASASKNFAPDCSNFLQFAKSRIRH